MKNKELAIKTMMTLSVGILFFVFILCLIKSQFLTAIILALFFMFIRVLWVNRVENKLRKENQKAYTKLEF